MPSLRQTTVTLRLCFISVNCSFVLQRYYPQSYAYHQSPSDNKNKIEGILIVLRHAIILAVHSMTLQIPKI